MPAILLAMFKGLKIVDDLQLTERRQRALPLLAMMIFLFPLWFTVKNQLHITPIFSNMIWGAFLIVMVAYFINIFFFKISLHALGMGGMVAIGLFASSISIGSILIPFIVILLIAGLVGSVRLALKAHQPIEIYYGYLGGFISMWFALT